MENTIIVGSMLLLLASNNSNLSLRLIGKLTIGKKNNMNVLIVSQFEIVNKKSLHK